MSRDNFLLLSGGLDSTVMAHKMHDEVFNQTRPRVVYFDTTVGLPANRAYVEMLSDHYDWQLWVIRTEENFKDVTRNYLFYGADNHPDIFEKLKGRQLDGLTTVAEDPHFYWGVYREESVVREKVVVEEWTDNRGAVHHAPLHDWSYSDIVDYAKENEIPVNPLWDKHHFTDCGCGGGGHAREELLEIKAEGFTRFAEMIEELEQEVEADDQTGVWAWSSFEDAEVRTIRAKADRAQRDLAAYGCGEGCSEPSLRGGVGDGS